MCNCWDCPSDPPTLDEQIAKVKDRIARLENELDTENNALYALIQKRKDADSN